MRKLFLLFIICLGSLSAQTFIGNINPLPDNSSLSVLQKDTIKILAVMADFLEDKDASTYGNGKFGTMYSKDYGNKILDPLPHNKNYFENHLLFAGNYFRKVSNNKLNISYIVLPDVYSVSKTMRNYTPPSSSDDLTLLGNFSKEVWQKVYAANPAINFNNYDIFLIFHAGVGRDVSVSGSFGNEKDLPSVYLSDKALKKIFSPDLSGLPINRDGKYNTMIIPETENREESSLGMTSLIQLTINGLIVSSIGSYIGLPDLFDTKTGMSAIGRFGLMDGQSIFAFLGAFPPEPSAWEKIFLGWEKAEEAEIKNGKIEIATRIAASDSDIKILKVPINSSEYFLIENRIRDANKDGAKVSYIVGNEIKSKTFYKDTTGFESLNLDSLSGVITDLDEFDWALPGNGLVIWHIDENIINANLENNKINIDKYHRGVDVEEADGIQDIGEKFTTILGDQIIGEGSEEDFWYKGNKAKLYKNKFTRDTQPNTNSYSGANSLISFSDFSAISNKMSFTLSWGDSLITPTVKSFVNITKSDNSKCLMINEESKRNIFVFSNSNLYRISKEGVLIDSLLQFSNYKPALTYWNDIEYVIGVLGDQLNVFMDNGTNTKFVTQSINTLVGSQKNVYCYPVIEKNNQGVPHIILGTGDGNLLYFTLGNISGDKPSFIRAQQLINSNISKILCASDYKVVLSSAKGQGGTANYFFADSLGNYKYQTDKDILNAAITKDKNGNNIIIVNKQGEGLDIIDKNNTLSEIKSGNSNNRLISIGDIKRDGSNYLVFSDDNNIEIRNFSGGVADHFPFADPNLNGFTNQQTLVDFQGDKSSEIIAATKDGRILAIDGSTGKTLDGFPISTGEAISTAPVFFNNNGKAALGVLTESNNLYIWNIGNTTGTPYWINEYGNNSNSSYVQAANSVNSINSFFPKERAYNWPNPVYDNSTTIRYYVGEDANINIKIFDLAGDFVAELNDFARGGYDNEIVWDVKNVQSGVYLARIEAAGTSGKNENNVIKIVVIK